MVVYIAILSLLIQIASSQQKCYGISCENVPDILEIEKVYNSQSGDDRYHVVQKVLNYTQTEEDYRAEVKVGRSECFKANTTCYPDVDGAYLAHRVFAYAPKLPNGQKGGWSVHCRSMACSEYNVKYYIVKDMLLKIQDEYNLQSDNDTNAMAYRMLENSMNGETHSYRLHMIQTACKKTDFKCDVSDLKNWRTHFSTFANVTVIQGRRKPVMVFKLTKLLPDDDSRGWPPVSDNK